jgi:glycosyltransferase involved in cell wall biosynthesis
MPHPLVSIIIPCYNTERFVEEAIQSALDQKSVPVEVIVVNDGSTDRSPEILNHIQDSRLRVIHQENRGLSGARNRGLSEANGEWIVFLDADDLLKPDALLQHLKILENHPEADVLVGGYEAISEVGTLLSSMAPEQKPITREELLHKNRFPVHAAFYRHAPIQKIDPFDTTLRAAEDWDFSLRLILAGARFLQHPAIVCSYRQVGNSMSRQARNQLQNTLKVIEKNVLPREDVDPQFKQACLCNAYRVGGFRGLLACDEEFTRETFAKAAEHSTDPTFQLKLASEVILHLRTLEFSKAEELLQLFERIHPASQEQQKATRFHFLKQVFFYHWDRKRYTSALKPLGRILTQHPRRLMNYILWRI